jgi:hypothetical protein
MPERWRNELDRLGGLQPSAGLWEQARQGPRRNLPRGHGTGRLAGALVALLVVSLVGYGLWSAFSDDTGPSPGSSGSTKHYRNAKFGWTVSYPSRMKLGHFKSSGLFESDGAWVGSFQANTSALHADLEHLRNGFPAEGVLFQLWWGQRLPIPSRFVKPDDPLPLSLSSFKSNPPYTGGSEPSPLYRTFWEGGRVFNVAVWIGPKASPADRGAMTAIVASIDFPRSVLIPNGSYLLFPHQAGPPAEGDENGGATLTITTNLPDGTIVLVGYDAGGGAGGSKCCPVVYRGQLVIGIGNQHCLDLTVTQSEGLRVTVGVAPAITGAVNQRITGGYPECPGTCGVPTQPASVLHTLGAHFERLTGDQVTKLGADNLLVATSQWYAWPPDTCGLTASRSP